MKKAFIIVDIQNDFLPGGSLPVQDGNKIIPIINKLLQHKDTFDVVVATKDWHPHDHGSFANTHGKHPGDVIKLEGIEQILWPVHCVQQSVGADFAPELDESNIHKVFYKGTEKNIDSYSTFFDNEHWKSTGLDDYLRNQDVTDVYVAGLATDYCVKYSVLDARHLGFNTFVVKDACRGVNLHKGDAERAFKEMQKAGAHLIDSSELLI